MISKTCVGMAPFGGGGGCGVGGGADGADGADAVDDLAGVDLFAVDDVDLFAVDGAGDDLPGGALAGAGSAFDILLQRQ